MKLRKLGNSDLQVSEVGLGCNNFGRRIDLDSTRTVVEKSLERGINSCQDEYSLLHRDLEKELIPMMEHFGMSLLPYFPLASGLLTSKYKRGEAAPEGTRYSASPQFADRYMTERNWNFIHRLTEISAKSRHSLLDLAFSWLLSRPVVACVIAGATKPEQVEANVRAADWELKPEDLNAVKSVLDPAKS